MAAASLLVYAGRWGQECLVKPAVQLKKNVGGLFRPLESQHTCSRMREVAFRSFIELPFHVAGSFVASVCNLPNVASSPKQAFRPAQPQPSSSQSPIVPLAPPKTKIISSNFFQSEMFVKLVKKEDYAYASWFCPWLLSLKKDPADEKIILEEIHKLDFETLDSETFLDIAIKIMEKIKGKKFNESRESALEIAVDLADRLNCTVFHGTNFHALEQISKVGLLAINNTQPNKSILAIHQIAKDVLKQDWLFFHVGSDGKPSNKMFVAAKPQVCVSYARRSPEWFSEFITGLAGNGEWSPDIKQRVKSALERLQKGSCCNSLSAKTAKQMQEFFEFYYKQYAHPTHSILLSAKVKYRVLDFTDFRVKINSTADFLRLFGEGEEPQYLYKGLRFLLNKLESFVNIHLEQDVPPENITAYVIPVPNLQFKG